MRRVVYIGGFGNGKKSAESVADALTGYYDDVDEPFTFSDAMSNQDIVRKAVRGADVITHSAGLLAIVGTNPSKIEAFGPPLPTTKLGLIGRTVIKTARMHIPGIGIQSLRDIRAVNSYDLGAATELVTNPRGNLGRLGQVARFDAVETAVAAQQSDIPTSLIYTNGDEYFSLSAQCEAIATAAGVSVTRFSGIHDELIIRPAETLRRASIEQPHL
jgi:hypothetical protein